ncbi:MAG: ABC transporter permease [Lachnospirales bacterium]
MKDKSLDKKNIKERLIDLSKEIWKYKMVYTLLLPGLIWMVIFAFIPMGGLILAFKDFNAKLGILGSPWAGFENFEYLFRDSAFWASIWKTIYINLSKMIISFPVPIILALMFNEIRLKRYPKVAQTIYTFPNFLSWIVVSGIIINLLSQSGLVNSVLVLLGFEKINFMGSEGWFLPILILSDIWKTAGWTAIIYIAAIAGIDQEQYEAASVDGASRLYMMYKITLPNIMPTVMVMFILAAGSMVSSSFDQVFNLSNPATKDAAEVLDMYIYRVTFSSSTDFSFSAAVSLFRSILNMCFLLLANKGAILLGGSGLFATGGKKNAK